MSSELVLSMSSAKVKPLFRNQFFAKVLLVCILLNDCKNKCLNGFLISDKPSPPLGPLVTSDNTEDSFTLSWNSPQNDGNSEIIEYIVEKKESDKKVWKKVWLLFK